MFFDLLILYLVCLLTFLGVSLECCGLSCEWWLWLPEFINDGYKFKF